MLVLGLTGSIAMGKSHAARLFRAFGVPVCDADELVHALFRPGGAAVGPVGAAFPGAIGTDGGIMMPRVPPAAITPVDSESL